MLTIGIVLAILALLWFLFCSGTKEHTDGIQPPVGEGVLSSLRTWSMRRKEKRCHALLLPPSPIVRITLPRLLKYHKELFLLVSPHNRKKSVPTLLAEMNRLYQDIEVENFCDLLIGSGHYPDGLDFSQADPQTAPLTLEITWLALVSYQQWKGHLYKHLRKKEATFLLLICIWVSITMQEYTPPPLMIEEAYEEEREKDNRDMLHRQPTLLFPITQTQTQTQEVPEEHASMSVERKNILGESLREQSPSLCQQITENCMDRMDALFQQYGKITQTAFTGSTPEQLSRREWDLLLTRGKGWCYQAGVVMQDGEGNVILAHPTITESIQTITDWIEEHWDKIQEKGKIVERV